MTMTAAIIAGCIVGFLGSGVVVLSWELHCARNEIDRLTNHLRPMSAAQGTARNQHTPPVPEQERP